MLEAWVSPPKPKMGAEPPSLQCWGAIALLGPPVPTPMCDTHQTRVVLYVYFYLMPQVQYHTYKHQAQGDCTGDIR